jgi:drug/metabolite transporter (DMT)-like permease
MNRSTTLLVLFAAALLEASGDALVRKGLHGSAMSRAALLAAGALVLFAYGCAVNSPPWAFGRLLGVYVVFFFLVAQAIGWLFFGEAPDARIWLGGACIAIGGAIISAGRL